MISESCQDISSKKINALLIRLLRTRSPETVQKYKKTYVTLWRWGWEMGHLDNPPRGIMRVVSRPQQVRAWTQNQLVKLMYHAKRTKGYLKTGFEISWMLTSWIYLGYETGARLGDLWAMRYNQIEGDTIRWMMSKTGDSMYRILSRSCLESIKSLEYKPNDLILGRSCTPATAARHMRALCKESKLPGSGKWLRRSGATHVEMEAPGTGRRFLGHRSHHIADRHYLDRGQIQKDAVQVRSIFH